MTRLIDKVVRDRKQDIDDDKKKYKGLTAGELLNQDPETFNHELRKSYPRSRSTYSVPLEIKRVIAILCKLRLVSQQTFADLLGIRQESIYYWIKKLDQSKTTDYWTEKAISDYKAIYENYQNPTKPILEEFEQLELGDEVTTKRANNSVISLLRQIGDYFNVKITRKSRRSKKLTLKKAA